MKFEWFFVIFAPGMAGHHLTNLLLTDDRFPDREIGISTSNAHPPGNPEPLDLINLSEDKDNVFCLHLAEYLWYRSKIHERNVARKFLVIEFPEHTRNQLFWSRLDHMYPYYRNVYLLEELSTMYSVDIFHLLTQENDITPVNVNLIFDPDPKPLIQHIKSNFNLILDIDRVQSMQTEWIKKIKA